MSYTECIKTQDARTCANLYPEDDVAPWAKGGKRRRQNKSKRGGKSRRQNKSKRGGKSRRQNKSKRGGKSRRRR